MTPTRTTTGTATNTPLPTPSPTPTPQGADLAVSLALGSLPADVVPGGRVQYAISFFNASSLSDDGAYLVLTVPSGLTYVSTDNYYCFGCSSQSSGPISITNNQLTFNLGTVGGNNYGEYWVTFQIDSSLSVNSTVTSTVQIFGVGADSNSFNNTSSLGSTLLTPSLDLAVAMPTPTGDFTPGGQAQYAINFYNYGNASDENATLTDTLPAGMSYLASTGYCGTCLGFSSIPSIVSGAQVVYQVGTMPVNASGTIIITVQIDPSVTPNSTLTNSATIAGSGTDSNPTNNQAAVSEIVQPPTDDLYASTYFSFCCSGSPIPGAQVELTLSFGNSGLAASQNAVLTDTLPSGVTYVSLYSATCYACVGASFTPTINGSTLTYNLGTMYPGSNGSITVYVQLSSDVAPGTVLTNTVSVTGTGTDTNLTNNAGSGTLTVVASTIDLSISQSVYPSYPYCSCPGGIVEVDLSLSNNGNSNAGSGTITDSLPSGLIYQSGTVYGYCYSCSNFSLTPVSTANGQIVFDLGTVYPNYYGGYIDFAAEIDPNATPGTLTNTVTISGTGNDTNPTNNTSSYSITIVDPTPTPGPSVTPSTATATPSPPARTTSTPTPTPSAIFTHVVFIPYVSSH